MMLTVHVIENDLTMRALLCEWLTSEGYRVTPRSHMRTVTNQPVDAVVVDLLDLRLRGAETVVDAKRLYAGAALIGISTQVSPTEASRARQAHTLGLDRLVGKPCSRRELVTAVAGAMSGRS